MSLSSHSPAWWSAMVLRALFSTSPIDAGDGSVRSWCSSMREVTSLNCLICRLWASTTCVTRCTSRTSLLSCASKCFGEATESRACDAGVHGGDCVQRNAAYRVIAGISKDKDKVSEPAESATQLCGRASWQRLCPRHQATFTPTRNVQENMIQ